MTSTLNDLNNHLFAQLDRLSEDCKTPEDIEAECQRAKAVVRIAEQIIHSSQVQLQAVTVLAQHGDRFKGMVAQIAPPAAPAQPRLIGGGDQ